MCAPAGRPSTRILYRYCSGQTGCVSRESSPKTKRKTNIVDDVLYDFLFVVPSFSDVYVDRPDNWVTVQRRESLRILQRTHLRHTHRLPCRLGSPLAIRDRRLEQHVISTLTELSQCCRELTVEDKVVSSLGTFDQVFQSFSLQPSDISLAYTAASHEQG